MTRVPVAKVTRPVLAGTFPRKRLFRLIDRARQDVRSAPCFFPRCIVLKQSTFGQHEILDGLVAALNVVVLF